MALTIFLLTFTGEPTELLGALFFVYLFFAAGRPDGPATSEAASHLEKQFIKKSKHY